MIFVTAKEIICGYDNHTMITVLKRGNYWQLTSRPPTLLFLLEWEEEGKLYVLADLEGNTGTLRFVSELQKSILFSGKYRLYETRDEKMLTDGLHLELLFKNGKWQGYLLPEGIPDSQQPKKAVVKTSELITKFFCAHCGTKPTESLG